MQDQKLAAAERNTYRGIIPPIVEKVDNPLDGKRLALLVDDVEIPLAAQSVTVDRLPNDVEVLTIVFQTTKKALANPATDAVREMMQRGFIVGQSVGCRFNGKGRSGVVMLQEFCTDVEPPKFKAKALTVIYEYTDKGYEQVADPGDLVFIEPKDCEKLP